MTDLMAAIHQIRPAAKDLFSKHQEWNQKFGNKL